MNPFRSSIYWRLLIWFCVANLLVLFLGGLLTRGFIEYTTAKEINWVGLGQGADQAYESGGVAALADWSTQQRREGIEATLYEKGRALYPIRLHSSIESSLPSWLAANRDIVLEPWPGLYVAVQPVVGNDGQPRQLVAISRTHTRLRPQTREKIFLAFQWGLSLLFIGLVGWWLARSVAKPVQALRDATRRMAAGELSTRVGRQGSMAHDELAQLALDFDAMAERIEALVAHDRSVLQDLSHELRSPLARLRVAVELARSGEDREAAINRIEKEAERLNGLVTGLLQVTRAEGDPNALRREPVRLDQLLEAIVADSSLEARARGCDVRLLEARPAIVEGDGELLRRAVENVMRNAVVHAPPGTAVEATLEAANGRAELRIRDYGPGVPEETLPRLFDAFYRVETDRNRASGGVGLGLSIARRAIELHKGAIRALNAAPGLMVEIDLPAIPAAA